MKMKISYFTLKKIGVLCPSNFSHPGGGGDFESSPLVGSEDSIDNKNNNIEILLQRKNYFKNGLGGGA